MAKVKLEVVPWLNRAFGVKEPVRFVREEEVRAGATVRELFNRLATQYQDFAEMVFNLQRQELTDHVTVIYNDRLLELVKGLDTEMRDGDTLTLLPSYQGGSRGKVVTV